LIFGLRRCFTALCALAQTRFHTQTAAAAAAAAAVNIKRATESADRDLDDCS